MCGLMPCPSACAQALTAHDLKTLPVENLAPRLLGEVGGLMIGIDRSNFPYDLKLFGKAHAPPTQYGMCASDWIVVHLDGEKIWSVSATPRFGVVDSIYNHPSADREKINEAACSRLTDTRDFFPAPDWVAAKRIVAYIDYLKGTSPFEGKKYDFECTGSCDGIDALAYVRGLELRNITAVSEIDCREQVGDDHCYRIDLTGSPPGLFPRELRVYGHGWAENAEVRKTVLWIGQTLF
jgi:hypothetical protein